MANRLFNYLFVFILILISFVIGFNVGSKDTAKNNTLAPAWWETQPIDSDVVYFYGTASAKSEDVAVYRAGNRAKQALIDYLKDEVSDDAYSTKFVVSKLKRTNSEIYYLQNADKNKAFVQYTIPKAVLETLKDEQE